MKSNRRSSSRSRSKSPSRSPRRKRRERSRSPAKPVQVRTKLIMIANIPYNMTWHDLKDIFKEKIGFSGHMEILVENNKSTGNAIMMMKSFDGAQKAIECVNRFDLNGRKLIVREVNDRDYERFGHLFPPAALALIGKDDPKSSSRSIDPKSNTRDVHSADQINSVHQQNFEALKIMDELRIDGPMTSSCFISNLPYDVDVAKLRQTLRRAGNLISVDLPHDHGDNSKVRGFGVIKYEHGFQAIKAISIFNETEIQGRVVRLRLDKNGQEVFVPPEYFRQAQSHQSIPPINQSQQNPSHYPTSQFPNQSAGPIAPYQTTAHSQDQLVNKIVDILQNGTVNNQQQFSPQNRVFPGASTYDSNIPSDVNPNAGRFSTYSPMSGSSNNNNTSNNMNRPFNTEYSNSVPSDAINPISSGSNIDMSRFAPRERSIINQALNLLKMSSNSSALSPSGGGSDNNNEFSAAKTGLGSAAPSSYRPTSNRSGFGGGGPSDAEIENILRNLNRGNSSNIVGNVGANNRMSEAGNPNAVGGVGDISGRMDMLGGPPNASNDVMFSNRMNPQMMSNVPPREESKSLYVHNLPFTYTERDLADIFGEIGPIKSSKVDNVNGRSKGSAVVEFYNSNHAFEAKSKLDGVRFDGRAIRVDLFNY